MSLKVVRDLYLAEVQAQHKEKAENWLEFGEDLRSLVDKAYPTLDDEALQQLALQRYLSCIMIRWHLVLNNRNQGQLKLLLVLHWNVNPIW